MFCILTEISERWQAVCPQFCANLIRAWDLECESLHRLVHKDQLNRIAMKKYSIKSQIQMSSSVKLTLGSLAI